MTLEGITAYRVLLLRRNLFANSGNWTRLGRFEYNKYKKVYCSRNSNTELLIKTQYSSLPIQYINVHIITLFTLKVTITRNSLINRHE